MRIAITELRVLFCSPIIWLIFIVLAFQVGFNLASGIETLLTYKLMGSDNVNSSLTLSLFSSNNGVFRGILKDLYLYIPLLTMGIISREISSGSIKLLYSSPLSNIQIVLGKYLSMLLFGLIFIAIIFASSLFAIFSIENVSMSLIFTALLGIYLTLCAYAAIGLFLSSLTQYQVIAAMGTLIVLAFLNYVGSIGQESELIRDITYWLSIKGRSIGFIDGFISSKDILYFILVILLFISLTIIYLNGLTDRKSKIEKMLIYFGVTVVVLTIGYVSSLPQLSNYYDATETKSNTLSVESQEIINKIDGDLTLYTFVNILDKFYYIGAPKEVNKNNQKYAQYVRFKPDIKQEHIYYYGEVSNPNYDLQFKNMTTTQKVEKLSYINNLNPNMFLSLDQIKDTYGLDLSKENNTFVRYFKSGEKGVFLRIYNDIFVEPLESQISTALKTLVCDKIKVRFVTGHGEREIYKHGEQHYSSFATQKDFRHSLVNRGFDVDTITLCKPIPNDIDILVVSSVKSDIGGDELTHFDEYVNKGGNVVVLGDDGCYGVNPLMERFGLKFTDEILVQKSDVNSNDLIKARVSDDGVKLFPSLNIFNIEGSIVSMPTALGIEYIADKGYNMSDIFVTESKGVWNEKTTRNFVDESPTLNSNIGEIEKSYSIIKYLTRNIENKEQRIFIIGDSDCISMEELSIRRAGVNSNNFGIIDLIFSTLSYNEYPVNTYRDTPTDVTITMDSEIFNKYKFLFIAGLASIILIGFISLWFKRRNN